MFAFDGPSESIADKGREITNINITSVQIFNCFHLNSLFVPNAFLPKSLPRVSAIFTHKMAAFLHTLEKLMSR